MNFNQEVYKIVNKIPKGYVATYGQIAALIGSPRAARQVGWALHQLPTNTTIPWHRVVNHNGQITTNCQEHSADIQAQLLHQEKIITKKTNKLDQVDLKKYLWLA